MRESKQGQEGSELTDGLGRDMEVASWLEVVDPASTDPNYWLRFQSWVMKNAAPELARRRLMTELTMGDVLSSWARTVIPTAVLAAALAGMLLFRGDATPAPVPMGVEEVLIAALEGATIPATLAIASAEASSAVSFASEGF